MVFFRKNKLFIILSLTISASIVVLSFSVFAQIEDAKQQELNSNRIKWVDFNVPVSAMEKALKADIENHQNQYQTDFITLLSLLGAKYWGEWKRYKASDMDEFIQKLSSGETKENLAKNYEKYTYFNEVYKAIFSQMIGSYTIAKETDLQGNLIIEEKYGLKAYSPIAYGYSFSHCDDFGNSRSFGYRRNHLGNDLMTRVGTPIVAVESGVVTKCGWNKYGGWRIGIRSFDGLRYYYYAHCRKGHSFVEGISEGTVVCAGQPIGYVGMTGYSDTENVNGMKLPHLHFGMQLIFDPSQEEGDKEIWIDVYQIVKFLEHHKAVLTKDEGSKDYKSKYTFNDPAYEEYISRQN